MIDCLWFQISDYPQLWSPAYTARPASNAMANALTFCMPLGPGWLSCLRPRKPPKPTISRAIWPKGGGAGLPAVGHGGR